GLVERARRVVAVVAPEVLDLPAVDAAVRVHVLEVRVRGGTDRAESRGLAAERDRAAAQELGRRCARWLRRAAAPRGDGEQGDEADEERAPHREIGFRSTGRTSCADPSETFAPAGIGGSR